MRVLHLVPYYKPAWRLGGPVRSVSRLCESLALLGADVQVMTTDAAGDGERLDVETGKPLPVDGVSVTYLPYQGPNRYFFAASLLPMIHRSADRVDLVHATGIFTFFDVAARLGLARSSVPLVLSPRGSFMPEAMRRNGWKRLKKTVYTRLVEKLVAARAAAVHCSSRGELDSVREVFPAAAAFVVPNGIDDPGIARPGNARRVRELHGVPESAFLFLYLGRLHPHKGIELTMRAFADACRRGTEAFLLMAGPVDGGTDRTWKDLAARLGIGDRCLFAGEVAEEGKAAYFAAADALVLNSYSESFGLCVAEALVSGLPVLISDRVGIAHWVSEHHGGIVTEQEVPAIAAAMRRMVTGIDALRRYMPSVRSAAARTFDPKLCAMRMLEHYRSIVAARACGSRIEEASLHLSQS